MSGMRIIDEEADKIKAERMIEIEKLRKANSGEKAEPQVQIMSLSSNLFFF